MKEKRLAKNRGREGAGYTWAAPKLPPIGNLYGIFRCRFAADGGAINNRFYS